MPTTQSQGNWLPAEGAELERLLGELADAWVEVDDVRVISPFRLSSAAAADWPGPGNGLSRRRRGEAVARSPGCP